MNKNISTLALLCALVLPACARRAEAAPSPDSPKPVPATTESEPAGKPCEDGCEDGCKDDAAAKPDIKNAGSGDKKSKDGCKDGCEDGCKDGCKDDAAAKPDIKHVGSGDKKSKDGCKDGCEDGCKDDAAAKPDIKHVGSGDKKGKDGCKDGCEDQKKKVCHDGCDKEAKSAPEIHLTAAAVQSNGVKVAKVARQALVRTLAVPARVAFNAEAVAHVGSPLRGRIAEWKVKLGDTVKKGDPLAVVDSPELGEAQADWLQKRAAAKTLVAGVDLAKAAWERSLGVYEKTRGITLTQVQQREAEYKAAVIGQQAADGASVAAQRKLHLLGMDQAGVDALALAGELAPHHTLRAPMDGQIIRREATLGEIVGPDREALAVVADLGVLWVLAEVPEAQLREVAVGAKAWVRLREDDPAKEEGSVSFLAPTVDEATRTLQARIELKGSSLKPGAFAVAQIALPGKAAPVLVIPEEAVQEVDGKTVVFVPVKGEANTFAARPVKLGIAAGDWVEVLSGLAEGEPFVAAGSFILKADSFKSSAPGCTDGCGG